MQVPTPWSANADEVLKALNSRESGLNADEAATRLRASPALASHRRGPLRLLLAQFASPLVLLLLAAAAISVPAGSPDDALIILAIVLLSGGFGFFQEYVAEDAVAKLLSLVQTRASVRRAGVVTELAVAEIAPGDVVVLSAGATIPGDARILRQNGLQVDESTLTGESFPAAKQAEPVAPDAEIPGRSSMVFLGTHVVSGTAEAVIVAVGAGTELGRVSERLESARPPTAFDLGLQRFGALLVRVSAALVLGIFAVNVGLHRPVADSLLFAIALAVGLVPELLPAIVTVNLARGARRMAEAEVILKRLPGIEDLGAIDVLCSDKTGTLTEGRIALADALGADGQPSAFTHELGWLNATFESGYDNPIDAALRASREAAPAPWARAGEVPYDFSRKRLSVAIDDGQRRWLVMKGALAQVLETCTHALGPDGQPAPLRAGEISAHHGRLAEAGKRVLGVAFRPLDPGEALSTASERDMGFAGLLAFTDAPKADVAAVIGTLSGLGVVLKVLTGDDRRAAAHLWTALHGAPPTLMTGHELRALGSAALAARVGGVQVFAEVDPVQKERVVQALRHSGRVVAYLGDGINDAPALRAADVGLSVEGATDVAREAADVVLRRRDLGVIANAVREGRRTMANTLKYVYYTTSANFGNMISMAFASLFLPFLPLLPKQILLNNLLSDIPATAIASDRVDEAQLLRPGRWSTREIRAFMFRFGGISSVFDIATFLVLYRLTRGDPVAFRTGWFVESLLTELFVLFAMRTRQPLWTSRPSRLLLGSTLGVAILAVAMPFLPLAPTFGLAPLSPVVLGALLLITVAYLGATEAMKHAFFARSR